MRKTCLAIDERFQQHDTGYGHPESPARLAALAELFAEPGFAELPRVPARQAVDEELRRVHDGGHLAAVAASAGRSLTRFDADTSASEGSFEAARLAAGAAIEMADAILAGDFDNGFAALRPPGHHAERDRPMGFCLFNNVAIVARHLRSRGLERVLVLDWDVHHGNGTQHSFYDDPSILYASTHQYPFYPGTGAPDEVGDGSGAGFTVNVPMPAGTGHDDYVAAFREVIVPVAQRFKPEFVLVSAGFDAHRADPLAAIELDTASYGRLTDAMVEVADASAAGRLMLLLEGGYNLSALKESVRTSIEHLRDPSPADLQAGEPTRWTSLARKILSGYWKI